jgi:hypothetical protein
MTHGWRRSRGLAPRFLETARLLRFRSAIFAVRRAGHRRNGKWRKNRSFSGIDQASSEIGEASLSWLCRHSEGEAPVASLNARLKGPSETKPMSNAIPEIEMRAENRKA